MRLLILILFSICFCYHTPLLAGNDPCGANWVSTTMTTPLAQSNAGMTDSGVDAPPYGNYQGSDYWIWFTAPNSSLYLDFIDQGIGDIAVAVYEGPCNNPKLIYNVTDSNCDSNSSPAMELTELVAGDMYFVRIWREGGGTGDFEVYLRETISPIVGFDVFDDASINGDCIDLTQNQTAQNGCAWYQELVDFSQPFTHAMQANFGSTDFNGADGICLVYQSNGPNYCGAVGGGIGALGMPNSAIFEFDTYQNGEYGDPALDHCAFNINGDINHATNIEGPVVLGNIEDGNLHDILFEWDPATNGYELSFDGTVILSGNYDIVANCFGGNNQAYWGFTSATGSLSNLHTICPINVEELHGHQTYEEKTICYGESYRGESTSGFYIDYEPMANGCQKQINFLLNVLPEPIPTQIDTIICEGESVTIAGQTFDYQDTYSISLQNDNNCDSLVIVDLTVVNPSVVISQTGELDCFGNLVILEANLDTQIPYESIEYTWSGGDVSGTDESVSISTPGLYELQVLVFYENDFFCFTSDIIEVEPPADAPEFDGPQDVEISCEQTDSPYLYIANQNEDHNIEWYFEGNLIHDQDSLLATEIGKYTVIVMDPATGCYNSSTAEVIQVGEVPNFEVNGEDIDCKNTEAELTLELDKEYSSYIWIFNNDTISTNDTVHVSAGGTYEVHVADSTGCSSKKSILVGADIAKPSINVDDKVGDCGVTQLVLDANVNPEYSVIWSSANDTLSSSHNVVIQDKGTYFITVTDTSNHCQVIDTFEIDFKGAYPDLLLGGGHIECATLNAEIMASTSLDNCTYEWSFMGEVVANTPNYLALEPGEYTIKVTSENGCMIESNRLVEEKLIFPSAQLDQTILECEPNYAELFYTNQENITASYWEFPDNMTYLDNEVVTNQEGWHKLIMKNGLCEREDSIYVQKGTSYPDFEIKNMLLDCNEDDLPLDFSISSDFLNIEWTGPKGFTSTVENPMIQDTGLYKISIDVDGPCDIDTFLYVTGDFDSPDLQVSFNDIDCNQPTSTILALSSGNQDSLIITYPDMTSTDFDGEVETNAAGQYIVESIGQNGCSSKDTFLIEENLNKPTFEIDLKDSLTCSNLSVDITVATDNSTDNLQWTGPNNLSSSNSSIEANTAGVYYLLVTNEHGCTNLDSVTLVENKTKPTLSLEGTDLNCTITSSVLEAYSNNAKDQIKWKSESGETNNDSNWEISSGGWYFAEAINELGCESIDSIFIEDDKKKPTVNLLSASDIELLLGTTDQININIIAKGKPEIIWIPSDGLSCDNCENPEVSSTDDMVYTMIVTDVNGCKDSITIQVRVRKSDKVYVPNIITQSGRVDNQYFTLFGNQNISNINQMRIYDRWGNKVFDKENFLPNDPKLGWNGRFKGQKSAQGVYAYIIEYENTEGKKAEIKGTVTLIR